MKTRRFGKTELQVSAVGMGCWAIGGPFWHDGWVGYGDVDDAESIRAVRHALDVGVTLFDTADAYGCGHSERVLGEALGARRREVVIATKFGWTFDEEKRAITGVNVSPEYVRSACEASLRRLNTDYIDLYQLHLGNCPDEKALAVQEVLEALVREGKLRYYGWSTDASEKMHLFAASSHCPAVQHDLNLSVDNPTMLALCAAFDLASINRSPLSHGILTGKFTTQTAFAENDMRRRWDWQFEVGEQAELNQKIAALRETLTSDGRTLAQAALGWLLTRSPHTFPIPSFKTVQQVEENAAAADLAPLTAAQMIAVETLFRPEPTTVPR